MNIANSSESELTLVGTNHKHAPIEIREQLSCQPQSLPNRLQSIVEGNETIKEVVILSTCNRTEIYTYSSRHPGIVEYLTNVMRVWSGTQLDLKKHLYTLSNEQAVRHLIAVTSGLDSLVAGEQQIQDQVRNAAKSAAQARTVGRFLSELFQHAYRAATNIREESEVGLERTSVSSAAISLLKKASIGDPIDSILLVGAGKMSTLAADDLSTFSKTQVWVANRTIERAKQLADRFGGRPLAFDEIPVALQNMHAVLTCTSADGYVLTEEQVKVAMSERAGRQLILIDASVPRNIDLAVARIPGVQLYNIDDLAPFLNKSDLSYRVKVAKAQHLVEVEAKRFYARIRAYDANGTLKDLWRIAEEIREKELAKAVRRLGDVSDRQQEILDILTRRIVNKLLYEPTVRLKEHASTGGGETYEAVIQELFAIDHDSQQ